jgi:hypothetical protein
MAISANDASSISALVKSFISFASFPNGRDGFPEYQLIAQYVLHRVKDDFFNAAPFRLHVIDGDA